MAFILKKLNKLPVRVKGTLTGEDGKPEQFDFSLHCKRLDQDEIDAVKTDGGSIKNFVKGVAEGWDTVLDATGSSVPFDQDRLGELIAFAGMPMLIMRCYLDQVSAAAKN